MMINLMIVLDIETSGLDYNKHSILSIGALDFNNPVNQFYRECRLEKDKTYTKEALSINGFSENEILSAKKPKLEDILMDFVDWVSSIKDKTVAGHNVRFDVDFMNYYLSKYNIPFKLGFRVVDLHSVAYANMLKNGVEIPLGNEGSRLTSDVIFVYVGLPPEPKPHNALTGAKMEAEALSRLIFGKNLLPEYSKYPIPNSLVDYELEGMSVAIESSKSKRNE
jgi:DNA polymerase-3 subunit epsilon